VRERTLKQVFHDLTIYSIVRFEAHEAKTADQHATLMKVDRRVEARQQIGTQTSSAGKVPQ
jgi:hypothetical protein